MVAVMAPADVSMDSRIEDRHIHGEGTPERAWRGFDVLARLEPLTIVQLAPQRSRVVVVAPHPDDEVLGCGGTLALLARAGHEVLIVSVTDGEAGYPGAIAWTPTLLARQRRIECTEGLVRLGLPHEALALGVPDGQVGEHEVLLTQRLVDVLRPGDTVLSTWRLDGHPDHEAAGRAASEAARLRGCRSWEFPVWMWHWAQVGDECVPWQRLRRIELDAEARERKAQAVAAHGSQLVAPPSESFAPVLPDWALARLLRPFEVFIAGDAP